jgi:hypothetical protein
VHEEGARLVRCSAGRRGHDASGLLGRRGSLAHNARGVAGVAA